MLSLTHAIIAFVERRMTPSEAPLPAMETVLDRNDFTEGQYRVLGIMWEYNPADPVSKQELAKRFYKGTPYYLVRDRLSSLINRTEIRLDELGNPVKIIKTNRGVRRLYHIEL